MRANDISAIFHRNMQPDAVWQIFTRCNAHLSNTRTVVASEILFADGCRLRFNGYFDKYFSPRGDLMYRHVLATLASSADVSAAKSAH
jgi:hypothetical protein